MTYETVVKAIGEALTARLSALLVSGLTDDDVIRVGADLIAAANTQAQAAGALGFAGAMAQETGRFTPPSPLRSTHYTDLSRLREAVATVMDTTPENARAGRLGVLASGETSEAAADAYGQALRSDKRVKGWVRAMDSNPCQLCRWWYRDGRVWPARTPIHRHTGCCCSQQPVTTTERTTR